MAPHHPNLEFDADPSMSRRALLRAAGLGITTLATAGVLGLGYRAYDQGVLEAGQGPAYAPWSLWERGADHVDVYADPTRRTGAIDPFDRELHVGLGAAIENIVLAAGAIGRRAHVELMPRGVGTTHVARVTFTSSVARVSPLYAQIPHRRTNRHPFARGAPVASAALREMAELCHVGREEVRLVWLTARPDRARLGELLVAATEEIIADPDQRASDGRWFRQDWDDLQRHADGITIDAAGLPQLTRAMAKLLPAQSQRSLGESWLEATRDRHTPTAAAYGIVCVRETSAPDQQLLGGRALQRVHLWATGAGLAVHHMNQVTERADRELQLGLRPTFGDAINQLVPDGWHPLASFRIGHPTRPAALSPRRSAEAVVVP